MTLHFFYLEFYKFPVIVSSQDKVNFWDIDHDIKLDIIGTHQGIKIGFVLKTNTFLLLNGFDFFIKVHTLLGESLFRLQFKLLSVLFNLLLFFIFLFLCLPIAKPSFH